MHVSWANSTSSYRHKRSFIVHPTPRTLEVSYSSCHNFHLRERAIVLRPRCQYDLHIMFAHAPFAVFGRRPYKNVIKFVAGSNARGEADFSPTATASIYCEELPRLSYSYCMCTYAKVSIAFAYDRRPVVYFYIFRNSAPLYDTANTQ